MFEVLFVLAVYGVFYMVIIEILEKCKHFPSHVKQKAHQDYQVAS